MEDAASDGYDRSVSQRAYAAPFGYAFRASGPHGGRTCCSVILKVVPRSRVTDPVRKPSAGRGPLGWGHVS
ncbi:hypothetical protein Taro_047263 [Colocasia esculenta]|uniref:Uncharacterized protein n=1 Tax=Colocasia esculenta TaxID=4460 RepID=A0A843X6Z2_COLES|nr:hypothetical protein [Colocasia esculenta]